MPTRRRASESESDEALIELAMVIYETVYGVDIPEPIAMVRSAWVSDPYIRGAYSFAATTTEMAHFDQFAAPAGRLSLCGRTHEPRLLLDSARGLPQRVARRRGGEGVMAESSKFLTD